MYPSVCQIEHLPLHISMYPSVCHIEHLPSRQAYLQKLIIGLEDAIEPHGAVRADGADVVMGSNLLPVLHVHCALQGDAQPSAFFELGQLGHLKNHTHSCLLACLTSTIFRLRTGHCQLLSHLHRLNIPNSDECPCGTGPQIPNHILQSYPIFDALRRQT